MKLRGWYIDGFGVFRDYEVNNLSDGLTVFAGPNEAGKSTLLAFLRGMLFGFPDRRSRTPRYPPLRGGRHGGRLHMSGPSGDYTVERYAGGRQPAIITLPSGRPAGDTDLADLLGGADDSLFRSVFAFSLTELQSFDSLGAEGVRDRIFSAGIAGAGRSAREASRQLRDRAATLLKTRGQAVINDLVGELDACKTATEQAQRTAIEYADRLAHEARCRSEIERLSEAIASRQQTRDRALLLVDLWPLVDQLQRVTTELEALDVPATVPEDAEGRLRTMLQEIAHGQRARDELVESRTSHAAQRAALGLNSALSAVSNQVEQLHESLSLHRSLLQQAPGLRHSARQAADALDEQLTRLGPGWDDARVAAFDGSIPRHEEVRGWQRRLEQETAAVERARAGRDVAAKRHDDLRQSRDRLAATLSEDLPEAETLERQSAALRRLRASMTDLTAANAAAVANEQTAGDRDRARRLLEAERVRPLPAWLPWAIATLGAGALATAGGLAAMRDTNGALLVAATGLALAALAAWSRRRRQAGLAIAAQQIENLAAVAAEHLQACDERDCWHQRADALSERVEADCATLDLTPLPSSEAVEVRDADLERQRAARLQWRDLQARLAEADALLEDATRDASRTSVELAAAERAAVEGVTAWDAWKRARDIPASLSAQGVLDYFEAVRSVRGLLQSRQRAQAEAARLAQRIDSWSHPARTALDAAGMEAGPNDDELIERLVALRRRCHEEAAARGEAAALDRTIAGLDTRIAAAEAALGRHRAERDRLFADVGATDESSFRSRLAAARSRSALQHRTRDLEQQLTARIGRGDGAQAIRAELATGALEGWRADAAGTASALEALQQQRDEAVGAHRDAQRARLDLEASADVARCALEAESLQAELETAVREWRTQTLARALIDDTLREFERTRQPAVLAEASRTFAFVSQGRYERIVQEETARDVAVLDARSGRRPVDALSRGTAEQLYLCIRLALASEFAARSRPLPFVMDDVLVNFDPDRARAVAQVVAEFARSHQVLAFTCHPSTRDLLLSVDAQAGLVELQPVEPVVPPRPARARPRAADPEPRPKAPRRSTPADAPRDQPVVRPASGE